MCSSIRRFLEQKLSTYFWARQWGDEWPGFRGQLQFGATGAGELGRVVGRLAALAEKTERPARGPARFAP